MEVPHLVVLKQNSRISTGTVLSSTGGGHPVATVRYYVGGTEYKDEFGPCAAQPGEKVEVYYNPRNPRIASVQDPNSLLPWRLLFCCAGALLGGGGLATYLTVLVLTVRGGGGRYLMRLIPGPHVTMTIIMLGVLSGIGTNLYFGLLHGFAWLSAALVLSGSTMLFRTAWGIGRESGWGEFVRTKQFALGALLAVLGNLIQFVR